MFRIDNRVVKGSIGGIVGCLLLLITCMAAAANGQEDSSLAAELDTVDRKFHQFSSRFYSELVQAEKTAEIVNIDELSSAVDDYRNKRQLAQAVALVVKNVAKVDGQLNSKPIANIIATLLEANELETASLLLKRAREESDRSVLANISFSFAKHRFNRSQWQSTIDLLDQVSSDLPTDDYNHAMLMRGISLQKIQKHREAIESYGKIAESSKYYIAARLNMAIANMREDWWTDAHVIINDLLGPAGSNVGGEKSDRLNTLLGYSLLQKQYYRNARDAFRNVSINGPYTNQALLGISLAAAYQEDYVGAMNVVRNLNDKKATDLPVEESYLLIPYFFEKLHQYHTALAGYSEAINHYEARINAIKGHLSVDTDFFMGQILNENPASFPLGEEAVDLKDKLPEFFFDSFRLLMTYRAYLALIGDDSLSVEFKALSNEFASIMQRAARHTLVEKIAILTSYMNQSRYGHARMYDNSMQKSEYEPQ